MQLDKFNPTMNDYLDAITMTAAQDKQINKALRGVLVLALYAFPDVKVYAQGSFATDTMVKPLTSKQGGGMAGEFDVDIALESDEWENAVDALNSVAEAIKGDETFGTLEIDNTKDSCVRIQYPEDKTGVAFHIDLVPTKLDGEDRSVPDRPNGEWKDSDAKLFADEFNKKASTQSGLRHTAVILKRLRDLGDLTDAIKSILILALVTETYFDNNSKMGDLTSVLDGVASLMDDTEQAPRVENPVNDGEDLAAGIEDYPTVRSFFVDTKQDLNTALAYDDADGLKEIFGPGFSYTSKATQADSSAAPIVQPVRAFGISNAPTNE